jgi:hypothetical protein
VFFLILILTKSSQYYSETPPTPEGDCLDAPLQGWGDMLDMIIFISSSRFNFEGARADN